MISYPKKRDLDGVYFRTRRDEKWCDICFSDLTEEERKEVMENRSITRPQRSARLTANILLPVL